MISYRAKILALQLSILRAAIEAEKWEQGKDDPSWVTRGSDGRFGKSSSTSSFSVDEITDSAKKTADSAQKAVSDAANSVGNAAKKIMETAGSIIASVKKYFIDKLQEGARAEKASREKALDSLFDEIDAAIQTKDSKQKYIVQEALLDAIEYSTRILEKPKGVNLAKEVNDSREDIITLEDILSKESEDFRANTVVELTSWELDRIHHAQGFDAKTEINNVINDNETVLALKSQGIDSKEFLSAANRLANESVARTPRERYLRDRDLERYLKRATELKELAKLPDEEKDPNAVRCRTMSIQSEIKNGAAIDRFLSSSALSNPVLGERARKRFVKEVGNDKPVKVTYDYVNPGQDNSDSSLVANANFKNRMHGTDEGMEELTHLYRTPVDITISLIDAGGFAMQSPEKSDLKNPILGILKLAYKSYEKFGAKNEKDGIVNTGLIGDPKMVAMHETTHIFTAKNKLTPLLDSYADSRKIDNRKSWFNYVEINNPQENSFRANPQFSQTGRGVRNTDLSVPYAAKTYAVKETKINSEILTVGVESLYSAKSLKSMSVHDREHLAFSIRVLQETTQPE